MKLQLSKQLHSSGTRHHAPRVIIILIVWQKPPTKQMSNGVGGTKQMSEKFPNTQDVAIDKKIASFVSKDV